MLPYGSEASFSIQKIYVKLTTFFWEKLLKNRQKEHIKVSLRYGVFEIFLTSAVICNKIVLDGNEIVQYLQNYKRQKVDQCHSRRLL